MSPVTVDVSREFKGGRVPPRDGAPVGDTSTSILGLPLRARPPEGRGSRPTPEVRYVVEDPRPARPPLVEEGSGGGVGPVDTVVVLTPTLDTGAHVGVRLPGAAAPNGGGRGGTEALLRRVAPHTVPDVDTCQVETTTSHDTGTLVVTVSLNETGAERCVHSGMTRFLRVNFQLELQEV